MSSVTESDDVIIQDLIEEVESLHSTIETIKRLRDDGLFKYLSKKSRNDLMQSMVEQSGTVEEISRVAFRSLKKVKRERVPEEVTDLLIVGNRSAAVAFQPTVIGTPPDLSSEED